jgi:hypothetical protein
MARQSTSVVTREQLAAEVPSVSAAVVAQELAPIFRSDQTSRTEKLFEASRVAFAAHTSGLKDDDIASATTEAMVALFPKAQQKIAASTSVEKGGATVTRVTIIQRRQAWGDLVEAGVTPTVATIEAAFRLTSTGQKGLSDMRTKLNADTKKQPAGKRADYYIAQSIRRLTELKAANAAAKAEESAQKSADKKAETPDAAPVQLDTAQEFIDYVRAEMARPWSDEDRALIMAALTEIVSA